MDATHVHQKNCSNNSNEGLRKRISKEQRLIVNAGNEDCFIPNAYI